MFKNLFFWLLCIFHLKILPGKHSHSELYSYSLFIFNIRIRYSWILSKIFANRNNFCQINIFANRNIIHEIKLWQIGIGIYLWHKYQQIDSWQIYLRIKNYSLNTVPCHMSLFTCHVSRVTCQMSCVTCHLSHVMCHMSRVTCLIFFVLSHKVVN